GRQHGGSGDPSLHPPHRRRPHGPLRNSAPGTSVNWTVSHGASARPRARASSSGNPSLRRRPSQCTRTSGAENGHGSRLTPHGETASIAMAIVVPSAALG